MNAVFYKKKYFLLFLICIITPFCYAMAQTKCFQSFFTETQKSNKFSINPEQALNITDYRDVNLSEKFHKINDQLKELKSTLKRPEDVIITHSSIYDEDLHFSKKNNLEQPKLVLTGQIDNIKWNIFAHLFQDTFSDGELIVYVMYLYDKEGRYITNEEVASISYFEANYLLRTGNYNNGVLTLKSKSMDFNELSDSDNGFKWTSNPKIRSSEEEILDIRGIGSNIIVIERPNSD